MAKNKPSLPKFGKKKSKTDETVYQGTVSITAKPKRKKWKIVLIIAIVLVVLVAAGMIFLRRPIMMLLGRNAFSSADVTVSTVQSATAETGTLSSTISATGNLAMTDTEDVTIPSGLTVDEVSVESGDTVTEGDTLATLNTTSIVSALLDAEESLDSVEDQLDDDDDLSDLEIEELEGQQAELEELIAALEALYDDPVITATCDGVINAVYVSDGSETSSSSSSSSSGSLYSTSAAGSASAAPVLTLLSASTDSSADSSEADSSADSSSTEDSSSTTTSVETITDFSALEITIPVTGETPQSDITETDTYTGSISWNCTSGVFKAETSHTATIVLTANDGYTFSSAELPTISGASYTWQIVNEGDSGAKLRIVATFGATDADETESDDSYTDDTEDTTTASAGVSSGSASGSISGGSSGGSASGSVSSGSSSSSTTDSSSSGSGSSLYSSSDVTAFTILKQDEVTISVSIDELDILSVSEGQTATVTLDALEDEEFTGTITSVGTEATSTSGNAKYTVEVTIEKTENMLSGMSASVVIQTGSTENAVLIPVAALQEEDGSTFVYTEADEDGNLSGEVEVETGLSSSSQVEITSGLTEGDTVYYNVTESDAASDEADSMADMFSAMNGGGEMPSGGNEGGGDFTGGGRGGGDMPSGGGNFGGGQ